VELAREACSALGISIQTSPLEAMLSDLAECYGNVAFYRRLVQELPTHPTSAKREEVVGGEDDGEVKWSEGTAGVYAPTYHMSGVPTGEAKPHVLVGLYNEERDRLRAVYTTALKLGIEDRQVKLAEQQGRLMADAVRGILTELGAINHPEAPQVVRKYMQIAASATIREERT
jgi:hypothetical protein